VHVIIIITSGSVTKAIGNFFKEIFSVISGEDSSIFLELNIELVK